MTPLTGGKGKSTDDLNFSLIFCSIKICEIHSLFIPPLPMIEVTPPTHHQVLLQYLRVSLGYKQELHLTSWNPILPLESFYSLALQS